MRRQIRVGQPIYSLLPMEIERFDSLAELALNMRWRLAMDTSRSAPHGLSAAGEVTLVDNPTTYCLEARSGAILRARKQESAWGGGFV
jgi:hypothetical protein